MKSCVKMLAAALAAAVTALSFSACTKPSDEDAVSVYMPDGAPALALAQLMAESSEWDRNVEYNVVDANTIQTYVTGEMQADICVLPVNAAAKAAGDGSSYTMLGVVTHGNLYMLSSEYSEQITNENLTSLVGKTVGCIQLGNFVGAVFKTILDNAQIEYAVISDAGQASADKVNLMNIADPAKEIVPGALFDYMIAAEPVITAKTASGQLSVVGNLQSLYGENGYPQAVMIAKNSLIEDNPQFIASFIEGVKDSAEWLLSPEALPADIAAAVNSHGGANSLTEKNLTKDTLVRCAVSFEPAAEARRSVLDFITSFNRVTGSSLTLADKFFYGYTQ